MPRIESQAIACAAIKSKISGMVVCGARHGNCINFVMYSGIDDNPTGWTMGFVDQEGNFLTREEAWIIADKAGQIRRPTGWEKDYSKTRQANIGDSGVLFSENLY